MPKITFIQTDGLPVEVDAPLGLSVLEIAHQNNIDLEGACEGSLACSTCHVIVDPEWYEALEKSTEDEEDMLDLAFGLSATSRLGCQIVMKPELDGLIVSLPAATRNMMFKGWKENLKREILTEPDPRLRVPAVPVQQVDSSIIELIQDMFETMYAEKGIGLAATQINVQLRVIVMDVANSEDIKNPLAMVNPEIVWLSEELQDHQEGCLSIPGHYATVTRPAKIRVKFLNSKGSSEELLAEGLLATCIQHEIDHLNGVLFLDHLSALKRDMVMRKILKAKKQNSLQK